MKVVFLDVDGVLNAGRKVVVPGSDGFHLPDWTLPKAIEHLNRITDATGANLVISSTWRIGKFLHQLREMFAGVGVTAPIIGKTENGPCQWHVVQGYPECSQAHRGFEIHDWIRRHQLRNDVERVEGFVILDDSSDMAPYHDRHVHTAADRGLTRRHVNQAIKMLGFQPKLKEGPCDDPDCLTCFPMPTL